MRVYLAARFDRREELQAKAKVLEASGLYYVNARWVKAADYEVDNDALNNPDDEFAHKIAEDDLSDIRDADFLIYFSSPGQGIRGGRHVEFGYALALGKPVIVCGPKENVFHRANGVAQYDTWEDVMGVLDPHWRDR